MPPAVDVDPAALEHRDALRISRRARKDGRCILAVRAAYRALQLDATPAAYVAIGRAPRDVGRWEIGMDCYRKSIELDDSPVSNRFAYLALAAALRGTGILADLAMGRLLARRVVAADPEDLPARETLAAIEWDLRRAG